MITALADGHAVYSPPATHVGYRLVTEYASDMLSVHDLDAPFTYLYASCAAKRLFGYEASELVGRSALDFIHPDDVAEVGDAAARLAESNETIATTYRFHARDGAWIWVESTCRPVPDPVTGVPVEVVATTRSVEARMTAEAERVRLLREADVARAAAENANRVKDHFLAMMSHELRTPLNAIAGHLEILQLGIHGPLTDEQRHSLARIDRSQRYLLRLVNDILTMERLRSGRLDYDLRPVRLLDVVQELEAVTGPQLAAHSLAWVVQLTNEDIVLADRERLVQVLINLVSNAIKFTPAGGWITVDCPVRFDGTTPEGARFVRVRDSGTGIPLARQAAIFEAFVQVDDSRSRRGEGAGLGLAISRELARGMGGDLRVRSTEGTGSSFTLSLRGAVLPARLAGRVV